MRELKRRKIYHSKVQKVLINRYFSTAHEKRCDDIKNLVHNVADLPFDFFSSFTSCCRRFGAMNGNGLATLYCFDIDLRYAKKSGARFYGGNGRKNRINVSHASRNRRE